MILFHHFQLKLAIYSVAKIYYQNFQKGKNVNKMS